MRRLILGCLAAIGAVVVIIAIVAILSSSGSSSSKSASSASATEPQQPTFSFTHGNATYQGTMVSDVGVTILGVSDSGPYFASGFDEFVKADGKFIIVAVAVSNRQNTAITMDTNLFQILDSSGNVYSASEKSIEVGTNSNLFLAQINPGVNKTGLVVFDVPQTLGLSDLQLRFRGGMTGDSAVLPLKVFSTEQQAEEPQAPTPRPSESVESSAQSTGPLPSDAANNSQTTASNSVSIGQTQQEVEAILGQPTSITTGAKHIYMYPHLSVIFVDGKVTEIHPLD